MSKKWICNTPCYVPVAGIWKLRKPGDPAEGEIDVSAQKLFDRVIEKEKPKAANNDELIAVKARLKELNEPFHHAIGIVKAKKLLAKAEAKKADV